MSKNGKTPIIVRKRKQAKHAHHGGSWKIAYADFMTAMMAFFLVMWLLSSSSPQELQQVAEYFRMPLRTAMAQGNRLSLSDSIIPGGGDDMVKQDGEVLKKTLHRLDQQKSQINLRRARELLESMIKSDPRLSNFQSNLHLHLTDDGLLIQIVDSKDRPMFQRGSKVLEPYMKDILYALAPVLNELPNRISLTGHTDSIPYASGKEGYSNWELSADRANASRQALIRGGMDNDRFLRVIGTADRMHLDNTTPDDPINRRISILVLSKQKEQDIVDEDKPPQDAADRSDSEKIKAELKVLMSESKALMEKTSPVADKVE